MTTKPFTRALPELWAVVKAPTPSNPLFPTTSKEKAHSLAVFYEQPVVEFYRGQHYEHACKRVDELEKDRAALLSITQLLISGEPASEGDFEWLVADSGYRAYDCMILSNLMLVCPEGQSYDKIAGRLGIRVVYEALDEIEDASDMSQDEFIAWLDKYGDTCGYAKQGFKPAGAYMTEDSEVFRLWAARIGGVEA